MIGGAMTLTGLAAAAHTPATLMLLHGRIYTVEPSAPWAEAVAIRGNRLVAVGSDAAVLALRGAATRVIDLHGRLVTPGLIDSHVHFFDGGLYLKEIALRDATTMAEVRARVARYAAAHPNERWLKGEGWSYGYPDLPGGEFHKEMLDGVSGNRPVFLDSSMAHAAWVNSAALRIAGITRRTPDPAGGQIMRDAAGEPTGWLKEDAAMRLVLDKIPAPSPATEKAALLAAVREANRLGLTRVDSAGGDLPHAAALEALQRAGALTLRVSLADWIDAPGLTPAHLAQLKADRAAHTRGLIDCCVAKFLMDGVIESHTAYLPGGYADRPAETGMRFFEPDAYKSAVLALNQAGFQVYTHAIGDGAIKLALDAYEAAQAATRSSRLAPARNRIEHAEAPDPGDIARFGQLDVIPSVQPLMIFPRDEWRGMEGLWRQYAGEKFVATAFALRSLSDAHATLAFGTDWPVVQLNPLLGLRNAVLRQSLDGMPPGGYVPEQRIAIDEAVRAYTLGAAYASRADADEGSLKVGKLADLTVFSDDFIEGPSELIAKGHVVMTVVDGKIVYRSP